MKEWERQCKVCSCVHDVSAFTTENGYDYGNVCIPCLEAREEESRVVERRTTSGGRSLLYNYGITQTTYDAIFSEQRGKCKVCGADAKDLPVKMAVDFNKNNGKIRGLLCNSCTSLLRKYKDDRLELEEAGYTKAANYLYDDGEWLLTLFDRLKEIEKVVWDRYVESKANGKANQFVLFKSRPVRSEK